MLWALCLCAVASAFDIVSFVSEGPSRSNRSNFPVRVTVSEALNPVASSAITIVKGSALRARANMPPNLDYDSTFAVELSNIALDEAATTLTFNAMVKTSSPSLEVPFLLQIQVGSLQSKRGSSGPDAPRGLVLVYDTKAPIANVTSLVGAYSNKDTFIIDVTFGERVAGLTLKDVVLSPAPGVTFLKPNITLINQTIGQYALFLNNMSGEGQVNVTLKPVADFIGNVGTETKSVSIVRDITPAILTLVSDSGTSVKGDSFGVSITSSEPILAFDDQAIIITIAQGRGAAGHTPLQMRSLDNTSFGLIVKGIAPAPDNNGSYASNLTVSLQVKEGSLTDRAGNPSPPKDSASRVLVVVVDVSGQNGSVITPRPVPPVVLSETEQKVGSISLTALIAIVCSLGAVLICCIILVCLKRRKEANEAPDAFKRYGRQVYAEYGIPPTAAGLTMEQIVQYGIEHGYDEPRSRVAAQRLLKAADTNNDGLLSSDEFIAWLAKVIHQQNKTKTKTLPGQDRRVTHRDVLTLKKVFPLAVNQKKNGKRPGNPAETGSSEEDPMISKPVSVHI